MSAPITDRSERRFEVLGLLAVLVLALAVRMRYLDTMLPWFLFEDEFRTTGVTIHLLKNRTLDPQHSFYPALGFYINAVFYYLWAAAGALGLIIQRGPAAVLDIFHGIAPTDPAAIMLSRWVSVVFGLASIVMSHLIARLFMSWRWALLCTLLVALNSMHVYMSILAKVDTMNLSWFLAGYYVAHRYIDHPVWKWLVPVAVFAALATVTKNNFQLIFGLALVSIGLSWQKTGSLLRAFVHPHVILSFLLLFVVMFLGSPYSFIRIEQTLTNAGWLYAQSELISFYHTDPHAWWLDRYYYLFSIVFPFTLGLPLFWTSVFGMIHFVRKFALLNPFVPYAAVWFVYVFAAGSGGPAGGSYPYYLYFLALPAMVIAAVYALRDLTKSGRLALRLAGFALLAVIVLTTVLRVDAFRAMYLEPYDEIGPWMRDNIDPRERVLMLSVHKPGPALGLPDFQAVWPHLFTEELIAEYDPDVLVVDAWAVAGFRKVYRDLWVAPLVDEYIDGTRKFAVVKRVKSRYMNRGYYVWLDPEHDSEIIVLQRKSLHEDGKP